MKYSKRILVVVGSLLAMSIAPNLVSAVENSGVGGKPANPRSENPRSESIFVYELKPEETVTDAVNLINNTNEQKRIEVYATDAQISSGGAFACEQKADQADQEGSWIRLTENSVDLGPNENRDVEFTLTVPKDVSVGEHNACIAIQAVEPARSSDVNGVQLSFRSAIRVAVTVPGDIFKQLTYEKLIAKQNVQKLLVTQQLKNNGNVSLDTKLTTKVKTIFGTTHSTIEGEYPILAYQLSELNFEFNKPRWGGIYRVQSVATYNSDTEASLGEDGTTKGQVAKSRIIFITPARLPLLLYFVVIAGIAVYVWRRHQAKRVQKDSVVYVVQPGDNIQSIAAAHVIPWRLLARGNKLKPPYALKEGDKIKVPSKADEKPGDVNDSNEKSESTKIPKKKAKNSKSKPKTKRTKTTKK